MNIYQSGIADNLTNPYFFTKPIQFYLEEEEALLLRLSGFYSTIIEVGCTKGRYTKAITESEKNYIGIDIASHHIADATLTYKGNDRAVFFCDDIRNLQNIIISMDHFTIEKSLLFFPFNCFGNLRDATNILKNVAQLKIPFAICTYATDEIAINEREKYYAISGFNDLHILHETSGVRFINNKGLNTIAYSENWFQREFDLLKLQYHCITFGSIGKAYCNFHNGIIE